MQRLQDYCVNCRPPPICFRLKSSIYNVIYENLVFIKYLIHKVSGSILFCLHNHNEQFTMEPVLFENHMQARLFNTQGEKLAFHTQNIEVIF